MNEKTRVQIEEMKKQTLGVEVEMNNIERSRAAKVAAEFFGTGRYENNRPPQRVQYLERMGQPGTRVEIPEGRFHFRSGQRKMRAGHPNPDLRPTTLR